MALKFVAKHKKRRYMRVEVKRKGETLGFITLNDAERCVFVPTMGELTRGELLLIAKKVKQYDEED